MAKTKYEDRTRQQIAADTLKEKGLFGTIGTYLSGDMPRSESMDDPQGRSNRRRKGMSILKQREEEGKKRAAELKRKKEQEIRKAKAARVLAQRKKEGEERAARLKKQKEEQIARRRAAPAVARAAGQATGETAKQSAMVAATKPAPKAPAPKPKAPVAKTPASKTPAPKAQATKSTPAPTGDKKYNVGVSKGGVPFKEAFRFHRNKALKGGPKTFTWNGKQYTTQLKKPVKKMGGGMMKSKMASKGGARGGRRAMGMKKGGPAGKFPDLTGDGKVTQADILKGRGVAKKKAGGMMKSKGYAKGGMMKSKGYAKGGAMKKKGYANGGAVKKKGMAKGGSVRKATKPRGVGAALRGYGRAMK
jgi:hypothetical protein